MVKEYASKTTRKIMTDVEIREAGLKKEDFVDTFKGKVVVLNPEESEIAKNLNIKEKGVFAVKLR